MWAWLAFHVSRLWTGAGGGEWRRYLGWLLLPVVGWIAWRFLPRKRLQRFGGKGGETAGAVAYPGLDSEFYVIERALADRGFGRRLDEPIPRWLIRIEPSVPAAHLLKTIAALYCRYRFDPAGISEQERQILRAGVARWRQRLASVRDDTR